MIMSHGTKMRIAIDARIINTGTGRYIERLLHHLEAIDTEHDYLVLVRKKDLNYYIPRNPRFQIVEADFADYSFGEQIGLARLLYKLKPDLVHFCMPQQPLFYLRPCVTTVHDLNLLRITSNDDMGPLELRIKKAVFALLLRRVAHKSRHIITPSHFTKDDLRRFTPIPETKITVTYEGVDPIEATPEPVPMLVDTQFLLYVGRAEPYKNNRGLIAAHQQMLVSHPNLQLVIVGRQDTLRQADMLWVEQKGYKNVRFVGFVSDAQLTWLYQRCAAYIVPSLMEGFGLPGLEAMAAGAPVASSNRTCLPEIYQDGAVYFDPSNTQEMSTVIAKLINDESTQKALRAKAQVVCGRYSWRRMAELTQQVYVTTLGTKIEQ